jgi:hypothetical protein
MLKDHDLLPRYFELFPTVKILFVQFVRPAALTQIHKFPALVVPGLQIAQRLKGEPPI